VSSDLDTVIGVPTATDPKAAERHLKAAEAAERNGERLEAVEEYRKAAELGRLPQAMFRLAFNLDLLGEEEEAIGWYQEL
jgi:tetratricopeptide (TPR) repeat protein